RASPRACRRAPARNADRALDRGRPGGPHVPRLRHARTERHLLLPALEQGLLSRRRVDDAAGVPRLRRRRAGRLVKPAQVVKAADEAGLRLVRFLWCGNDGTIRGKASALRGLEGRLESGIGLTVGMQAMNSLDQLQPVEGMGPIG